LRGNFDTLVQHILNSEGGYSDHPADPGGTTNMGITRLTLAHHRGKPVSKQDVRDMTREEAVEIYRLYYWDTVRGDELPSGVDLVAFDGAVNSGVMRSAKWLQRTVGVKPDGRIGPITLNAIGRADPAEVIKVALAKRMAFLRKLDTWATFGGGWKNRILRVKADALALTNGSDVLPYEALGNTNDTQRPVKQAQRGLVVVVLGIIKAIITFLKGLNK
jgi:lysozyme family protein